MRLLVVTGRWDLVGGSERYAGAVVRGLEARGHAVGVLCASGEQHAAAEVMRLEELDAPRLSAAGRTTLRQRVRAFAPDRILLLSRLAPEALGALLECAPLVRFVQDHTLFCPGLNKLHEDGSVCEEALGTPCFHRYWLEGGCTGLKIDGAPSLRFPWRALSRCLRELELTRRSEKILVASRYMRSELLRAGLPSDRIEVLPYFTLSCTHELPPAALPAATRAFVEAEQTPLLFTPARLTTPDKGVEFLLTAMGRLGGNARLAIAGDGPAREWLEAKAREERLEGRVHFAGWLGPGEIESLYAAADVVVFPSVWNEPFGLVGLEAMAHGKPVVAFEVGGVPEWLVDGKTGFLCERRDTGAMSAAIASLLADPALAVAMGAAGRRRVRKRSGQARHLDRLEGLLELRATESTVVSHGDRRESTESTEISRRNR